MTVDPLTLRRVMARFATGVTVVGTRHRDGGMCGLTANAFTSVSLSPPEVLVCVSRGSASYACLREAGAFVASFLSSDQHAISARFAQRRQDKFEGIAYRLGKTGLPVIAGSIAHVECEVEAEYPGGDHAILLARVVAAEAGEGLPLVFFAGGYTTVGEVEPPRPGEALPDVPEQP